MRTLAVSAAYDGTSTTSAADAVRGGALELGQHAVDRVPRAVGAALAHRAERHHQRRRLGAAQPQRAAEVVGVGEPDHAVALLRVQRLHVDVDQVARSQAGQPAVPEHLEVTHDLLGRDAEVACGLLERHLGVGVEVGHQRQQPRHLLAGAAHAGVPATAESRSTTRSRSSGGSTATTASSAVSTSPASGVEVGVLQLQHVPALPRVGSRDRATAQVLGRTLAHPDRRPSDRLVGRQRAGQRAHVGAVGYDEAAGPAVGRDVADDPREPEQPGLPAVGVVTRRRTSDRAR